LAESVAGSQQWENKEQEDVFLKIGQKTIKRKTFSENKRNVCGLLSQLPFGMGIAGIIIDSALQPEASFQWSSSSVSFESSARQKGFAIKTPNNVISNEMRPLEAIAIKITSGKTSPPVTYVLALSRLDFWKHDSEEREHWVPDQFVSECKSAVFCYGDDNSCPAPFKNGKVYRSDSFNQNVIIIARDSGSIRWFFVNQEGDLVLAKSVEICDEERVAVGAAVGKKNGVEIISIPYDLKLFTCTEQHLG